MYLLDTNVWLERLLDQTKSEEVGILLNHISSEHLFITDFAFHSIGVVLSKLNKMNTLLQFVQDAFMDSAVSLIHLRPEDMHLVALARERFNLDFDDAYQYVAAEKYTLTLVSFDADFDLTDRGKKTPGEIRGKVDI